MLFFVSQVYLPGDPIDENEKLTYDTSAYNMYHEVCNNNDSNNNENEF